MIKLLLMLTLLIVTGCTGLPSSYDSTEFGKVADLNVSVTRTIHNCDKSSGINSELFWDYYRNMNLKSYELQEFVAYKSEPDMSIKLSAKIIADNSNDFLKFTTQFKEFDKQYCIHKLSNIQTTARILEVSLGGNPGSTLCDNTILDRVKLFDISLKDGLITQDEYQNLLKDLLKIKDINDKSCGFFHRREVQSTFNTILPKIINVSSLIDVGPAESIKIK